MLSCYAWSQKYLCLGWPHGAADSPEDYFCSTTWKSALTGYFIVSVAKPLPTPYPQSRRITLYITGFYSYHFLLG